MEGRRVLITGAGIGIGRSTAIRFASAGYHVYVTDVLISEGESVVNEILELGGSAKFLRLDVTNLSEIKTIAENVSAQEPFLNALVCNAGIAHRQPMETLTDDQWDLTMNVDLRGMMYAARAFADLLKAANNSSIVCLSSIAGAVVGWAEHVPYVAAKAGVTGLVRGLAIELAASGIRVNGIAPGLIRTAQSMSEEHSVGPEGLAAMEPSVPLGRIGDPEDIAGVAAFLASQDASYLTGQTLVVDGGLTASL